MNFNVRAVPSFIVSYNSPNCGSLPLYISLIAAQNEVAFSYHS